MNKKKKENLKNNILVFLFLLLISFSVVTLFSISHLGQDNCNYAIEEIHEFNKNIFNKNINTIESEFSPRYYANVLMAIFMRVFNSNWFEMAYRLIKINYILYGLAATIIVMKFLKKNRLIGVFIITLCLMTSPLISISFGLNFAPDVFLGTAAPLTFLALVCVLGKEKYWLIGWGLALISTFLHIHEGFWCAFLLGIIWLATSFADKKIDFKVLVYICIYLFFLGIIVIPPLINSSPVDENYFTQIYVYIRTPHHLLLSFIGKWKILTATILLLFISMILYLDLFKYRKYKNERRTIFILCFLSVTYVLLYFLHYLSTEIYKIPFIITMYIPKSFRFFTFLGLINYIILGLKRIEKKKLLEGSMLLIIPFLSNLSKNIVNYWIILIFFIIFIILDKYKRKMKNLKNTPDIFIYLFIFLLTFKNYSSMRQIFILLYCGILVYEFIFTHVKKKNVLAIFILLFFSSAFYNSMKGKIYNIIEGKYQYISGIEYAQKATNLELYEIAIKFRDITSLNEGFLADPYSPHSNYFQLFSERNCYVLYKNVPSQKHLVIEWYERFLKAKVILEGDEEKLKELLEDINLKYILLSADKFKIVEDSKYFTEVIKNRKFGIFKLRENTK